MRFNSHIATAKDLTPGPGLLNAEVFGRLADAT